MRRFSDSVASSVGSRFTVRRPPCGLPLGWKGSARAKCGFRSSMAGLDFPLSTLHPVPRGSRRMTRGRIGYAILISCGSCIRYSPPALTDFDPPFSISYPLSTRGLTPPARLITSIPSPRPTAPESCARPGSAAISQPIPTTARPRQASPSSKVAPRCRGTRDLTVGLRQELEHLADAAAAIAFFNSALCGPCVGPHETPDQAMDRLIGEKGFRLQARNSRLAPLRFRATTCSLWS